MEQHNALYAALSGRKKASDAAGLDIAKHGFTMSDMRTAKTVSITLPPDLLVKAQEIAQREHRTMSELFREALRRYMQQEDADWQALLARTHAQGRKLGIASEADVERFIEEDRRDRRPDA